ncbi:hypothetical protein ACFX2G_047494 [Malus domestica]
MEFEIHHVSLLCMNELMLHDVMVKTMYLNFTQLIGFLTLLVSGAILLLLTRSRKRYMKQLVKARQALLRKYFRKRKNEEMSRKEK